MNVIVAGCRDFNDYEFVKNGIFSALESAGVDINDVTIISGGQRGVDKLGERFALEHGLPLRVFQADWNKFGNYAGPLRNREMAKVGEILVAFWDGQSKGTKSMLQIATSFHIRVHLRFIDRFATPDQV